MHRISFQRTTRPRREPREHAVVSDLIRWYLHSPLLIPARPPRCSAMRNRSLTAIKAITQALLDRRASRVETRNFEILGDWFLNSSRNDHQGITSTRAAGSAGSTTATAEGVAAAVISTDSTESALATTAPRALRRTADMTRDQWKRYKKTSKRLARSARGSSGVAP